ncbi:hypothetical protein Btru_077653 [Bulinus truncatus]|nr:hypothetical protein Btru_077653 [Bulinus truncatus]
MLYPTDAYRKAHIVFRSRGTLMLLKKYLCDLILVLTLIFTFIIPVNGELENSSNVLEDELDIIVSKYFHVSDTHRKPRDVSQCQPVLYKNVSNTRYQAYSVFPPVLPLVEFHHMLREFTDNYNWVKQQMHIHHQVINNPTTTWSVLEPGQRGSCRNDSGDRFTVVESSLQKNCIVAANAGFFNTKTGQCLGKWLNFLGHQFI